MSLPLPVEELIAHIEHGGYECYAVGGCVRDLLRGVPPTDFDLCTNALPAQLLSLFAKDSVIPSGIAHGTVTVLWRETPYEITTYRSDGAYLDCRHPQSVAFVGSLSQDLARRDFTINAMALHPRKGLFDPFGGEKDLANGVLRTVGPAQARFSEDALRILRGIRFCATLSLEPQAQTKAALFSEKEGLLAVSAERCASELCKTLSAPSGLSVMAEYLSVFRVRYPQVEAPLFSAGEHSLACALALCFPNGLPPYDALPLPKQLRRKSNAVCEVLTAVAAGKSDAIELSCRYGSKTVQEAVSACPKAAQEMQHALCAMPCPAFSDLALRGDALLAMGLRSEKVGQALRAAYLAVNRGTVENTSQALLAFCKQL